MSQPHQFIGEPVTPVLTEAADPGRMGAGEPALPGAFRWRNGSFTIAGVVRRWKEHGPCRHGSGESYLRKHWYEVITTDGRTLTLYCERQPGRRSSRGGGAVRSRWRLFSVSSSLRSRRLCGQSCAPAGDAGNHDSCRVPE